MTQEGAGQQFLEFNCLAASWKILFGTTMRRISLIAAALVLIPSMLSHAWIVDLASMKNVTCHHVVSCSAAKHTEQQGNKHHCDGEVLNATQSPVNHAAVTENDVQSCAMNCCDQATLRAGTGLIASCSLPAPATFKFRLRFPSIAFVSVGFSSYTDRGPPIS